MKNDSQTSEMTMEEIPSPSPVGVRPKTVAEQFVERTVAWTVSGGFVFGIVGVAFGLVALPFLGWEVSRIWVFSPLFTCFLVGTILGAVVGLLIGAIGGVIRHWVFGDSGRSEKRPPPAPPESRLI
jgi:hypothetical protein